MDGELNFFEYIFYGLLYALAIATLFALYKLIGGVIQRWVKKVDDKLERKIDRLFFKKDKPSATPVTRREDAIAQHQQRQQPTTPPAKPVEPECQHDWFCGVCRKCGKTEGRFDNFGHDFVCGRCTRCGKEAMIATQERDSHKLVDCKCTVCGKELHVWVLDSASGLRENFKCLACGKRYTKVYRDENDHLGTITYL